MVNTFISNIHVIFTYMYCNCTPFSHNFVYDRKEILCVCGPPTVVGQAAWRALTVGAAYAAMGRRDAS